MSLFYVPEEVVMSGGSPSKIFDDRDQIRDFIRSCDYFFEDQCSHCSHKPGSYSDLTSCIALSSSPDFEDITMNLCEDCEDNVPDFLQEAIDLYDTLPSYE